MGQFTPQEIKRLLAACIFNDQIHRIIADDDVLAFYVNVTESPGAEINPIGLELVCRLLRGERIVDIRDLLASKP